jgi:branched-chain amino acid transport system substrate-binding protein
MRTSAAFRAHGAAPILLLLAACGPSGGAVRVGLSAPLTSPAAAPLLRAAHLAAQEINAAGGIGGRPLELVLRDDYDDPDSAVLVAARFHASDVVAVIGSVSSAPALSAAPTYNGGSHPLIQLLPSAAVAALSDEGPYTFRLCATDQAYGTFLAGFARSTLGAHRAAILYVNDEEGRELRQGFAGEFVRQGGDPPAAFPFAEGHPEVAEYLQLLRRAPRPEVLLLAAGQGDGSALIRAARLALPGVELLGGTGLLGIEAKDSLADGMYLAVGYLPWSLDVANRSFVQGYRKAYPDAGFPDQGAAAAYDGLHLLATASIGSRPDRARLQQALAEVGSARAGYTGVIGPVRFDANGDLIEPRLRIGLVRGGRLMPVH